MSKFKIEVDTTGDGKANQVVTVEAESEAEARALVLTRGTPPPLSGDPALPPLNRGQFVPPSAPPPGFVERLGRAGGLTLRDVLEAGQGLVAGPADILSSGINALTGLPGLIQGGFGRPNTFERPFTLPTNRIETLRRRLDPALPVPRGAENISSAGNQLLIQNVLGAQSAGQALKEASGPVTRRVGEVISDAPNVEAISGFASGAGREASAQAGGTPGEQAVAELAAGVVAPVGFVTGGRAIRGASNLFQSPETQAGNILRDAATDPTSISRAPTGTTQTPAGELESLTTGPATRDPGLLGLEASLRRTDTTGRFVGDDLTRERARRRALNVIGKDKLSDIQTARSDLDPGTELNQTPVETESIVQRADELLQGPNSFREQTQIAVSHFRERIAGTNRQRGPQSVQELWNIRQDINDAMFGKFSAQRADRGVIDPAVFRGARQDLKALKEAIDAEIEKVVPGFRAYLNDYATLSGEIQAREAISGVGDTAVQRSIIDPVTGEPRLSQAQFGRQVKKIMDDRDIRLTDDQRVVMAAIARDLDLQEGALGLGRVMGSNTPRDLSVAQVIGLELKGLFRGGFVSDILANVPERALSNRQVMVRELLIDAMLDPRVARVLLDRATPQNTENAVRTLREFAGITLMPQLSRPEQQFQQGPKTLTDFFSGLLN